MLGKLLYEADGLRWICTGHNGHVVEAASVKSAVSYSVTEDKSPWQVLAPTGRP